MRTKKDAPDHEERRRELVEWRRRLALNSVEAGNLLHYSSSSIRKWERGEQTVPDDVYRIVKEDNEEG